MARKKYWQEYYQKNRNRILIAKALAYPKTRERALAYAKARYENKVKKALDLANFL